MQIRELVSEDAERFTCRNVGAMNEDVTVQAIDEPCVGAHDKLYRAATLAAALLLLAGAAAA